jgi:hypothetical protein
MTVLLPVVCGSARNGPAHIACQLFFHRSTNVRTNSQEKVGPTRLTLCWLAMAEALAAVPQAEQRVILATGSYIGEGFDDARLDTLFLAMPISWRGTLQQYVGRLHRLHDSKRVVQVYD